MRLPRGIRFFFGHRLCVSSGEMVVCVEDGVGALGVALFEPKGSPAATDLVVDDVRAPSVLERADESICTPATVLRGSERLEKEKERC